MKEFRGKVAAITGAGSGIGRALAIELASRGAHLAVSDVDATGLAETVALCEGRGAKVSSQILDVARKEDVHAWADAVVAEHGKVNLIFNNAGVALGATVESMSYEDLEWLIGINFWGVVYGTKAFLPHLIASGDGHVVNISSVFGLISVPTQSAYNAAKFGVRGFTDALHMELGVAGHPVSSTTVHPGGILQRAFNERLGLDFQPQWVDMAWLMPAMFEERGHTVMPLDHWLECFGLDSGEGRRDAMANTLLLARIFQMLLVRAVGKQIDTAARLVDESRASSFLRRTH